MRPCRSKGAAARSALASRCVIPTTALQDAAALLTVAMEVDRPDDLRALVVEFREKDASDELMLAVVALCRSLCLATAKVIHVLDDHLTDEQGDALTDDELLPVAMQVVRSYATAAALNSEPADPADSN